MERFTREQVLDILRLPAGRLLYWERLGLIQPLLQGGRKYYTLQELMCMRTVVRLTRDNVAATRLRAVVARLREDAKKPLLELHLESRGGHVVHRHEGRLTEPLSGQQFIDFTAPSAEKVAALHQRSAEQWLDTALRADKDPKQWSAAVHAYQQAIAQSPSWEAHVNLGTLHFKMNQLPHAEAGYRAALELAPREAVIHFNLANVLDELARTEEAMRHLREALRLRPDYADAHFNLALLLEKASDPQQAALHWQRYVHLDADSEWSQLARQHLAKATVGASNVVPLRRR